jgi:hypothetical protein
VVSTICLLGLSSASMGNRPIHAALLCYTTDDSEDSLAAAAGEYATCPSHRRKNHHHPNAATAATTVTTNQPQKTTSSEDDCGQSAAAAAAIVVDESPKSTHPEFCTSMSSETMGREARTDNSHCGCVRGGDGTLLDGDEREEEEQREEALPDDLIAGLSRQPSSVSESD